MSKASDVCAKCNSDKIIPRARVVDHVHYGNDIGNVTVAVYENPEAMLFTGKYESDLVARVCGSCGYVELYVADPGELYATHERSKKDGKVKHSHV